MSEATATAHEPVAYNEEVIRKFAIATMFWGVVAFAAGTYIAFELAFPLLNLDWEYTSFGRLRPLHTSSAIFAFGGNALMAASLYCVQRTCGVPLFGGKTTADFLFWGYQFFIVMAAWGYVNGVTQGKEYAEP
jgi:cytochrome c oxidase cbb3-type subunit 1